MNEQTNERLTRFINLLKGIFELDKSDLDFGIYRIMNIRKEEIEKFLDEGLPQKVEETLAPFASKGRDELLKKKADIEKQASDLGVEISTIPKLLEQYESVKRELACGTDLSALETDVYSALYSFFNRYYDDGDFISKRRYKEGVYAIPYEGEEVKLYWANQDQYYIKTSENFKDYVFTAGEWTVHFNLVDATTEQNNNKETDDSKRVFMLFNEDEENYPGVKTFECDAEKKELIIRFVFDIPADKKKKYDEENYTRICDYIVKEHKELMTVLLNNVSTDKKNPLTLMQKHLKGYVAKNTFDYFIHKDLGGFLSRELDFFIKNEVMHLDDLDTSNEVRVETYLAKVKAIKKVGKIIIDFLAQIENFQKKLWLKKKFVVETNWCITLDKIDESFYEEIRNNKEQVQEWIEMYAIDEIVNDVEHQEPWTNPPSIEFLRQNKNLLIDTKNFSEAFKEKLVATIDGLDEITNGLMINGDNFHGLSLLQTKYKGMIAGCYIDPPYNTGNDGFIYKDGFSHSSWLSMFWDRYEMGQKLLKESSPFFVSLNSKEFANFISSSLDVDIWFSIKVRHEERLLRRDIKYQDVIEYLTQLNSSFQPTRLSSGKDNVLDYVYSISVDGEPDEILNIGGYTIEKYNQNKVSVKKNDPSETYLKRYTIRGSLITQSGSASEFYELYLRARRSEDGNGCLYKVLGMGQRGDGLGYRYIMQPEINGGDNGIYFQGWPLNPVDKGLPHPNFFDFVKEYNDCSDEGGLKFSNGKKPQAFMNKIFEICGFENKDIILDYFAGSGSTGQAVNSLVRNGGQQKYVLIEMGGYFNKKILRRMKNVVYSTDWKSGKPQNRNTGVSQIIKYMKLESYEDALSNIVLEKPQSAITNLFGDEYLINYMMDIEAKGSLLNVGAFKSPFEYQMKITEKNESKLHKVDVVETFNYLVGLTVVRQGSTKYYSIAKAKSPEYEGAVELANDSNGKFAFRQIEGVLPDGRRALIIWRNVGDDVLENNAALDAYFTKYRINPQDREFDVIYVNGDNNLENLKTDSETWKVQLIETEFNNRMFEEN